MSTDRREVLHRSTRWVLVLLLSVVAFPVAALGAVQETVDPQVIAVEDQTFTFGCSVTRSEVTPDGSTVLSTWDEGCPPGSNLHTFITTESDAISRGALYAPYTGDPAADTATAAELQAALAPSSAPLLAPEGEARVACSYQRYTASGSAVIDSRNFQRAYITVDYAQDEDCYGRIYNVTWSFAGTPVYWKYQSYPYPVSPPESGYSTGCQSFGTTGSNFFDMAGNYGWKVNLGGSLYTEIEDLAGCTAWGNSYTHYITL
jgi:hypothetical protein